MERRHVRATAGAAGSGRSKPARVPERRNDALSSDVIRRLRLNEFVERLAVGHRDRVQVQLLPDLVDDLLVPWGVPSILYDHRHSSERLQSLCVDASWTKSGDLQVASRWPQALLLGKSCGQRLQLQGVELGRHDNRASGQSLKASRPLPQSKQRVVKDFAESKTEVDTCDTGAAASGMLQLPTPRAQYVRPPGRLSVSSGP